MEKPMYEILSNDIEMVEDMIDALMIVPKGYKLHPMGNKCAWRNPHVNDILREIIQMIDNVNQNDTL